MCWEYRTMTNKIISRVNEGMDKVVNDTTQTTLTTQTMFTPLPESFKLDRKNLLIQGNLLILDP